LKKQNIYFKLYNYLSGHGMEIGVVVDVVRVNGRAAGVGVV
jgi:hypothetical protein